MVVGTERRSLRNGTGYFPLGRLVGPPRTDSCGRRFSPPYLAFAANPSFHTHWTSACGLLIGKNQVKWRSLLGYSQLRLR